MHLKRAILVFSALVAAVSAINSAHAADARHWNELRGVFRADFNQDGSRVIARLRTDEIGIWDVEQGTRVTGDLPPNARSKRHEMSGDHRLVLIGLANGSRVFDASTATAVSPMLKARVRDQLRSAAVFSPDNSAVVIFEGKQTSVWDLRTGKRIVAIPAPEGPHEDAPPSAIFTADGTHCLLMDANGTVTPFETRSWKRDGKPMRHPRFDTAYEFGFAASADGRWVATFDDAGENGPTGQLQIWDATTSKPLGRPLVGVNGFSAQFLTNPARVIVQPARGNASVAELPSMKVLYTIKAHDEVEGPRVEVSPDGKWILAWGFDRTMAVLDSSTGETKSAPPPEQASIRGVVLAPNSAKCFVGYDNSTSAGEGKWDTAILARSLPELNTVAEYRSANFLSEHSLSSDGGRLLVLEGSSEDERLLIFNSSDMSPIRAPSGGD